MDSTLTTDHLLNTNYSSKRCTKGETSPKEARFRGVGKRLWGRFTIENKDSWVPSSSTLHPRKPIVNPVVPPLDDCHIDCYSSSSAIEDEHCEEKNVDTVMALFHGFDKPTGDKGCVEGTLSSPGLYVFSLFDLKVFESLTRFNLFNGPDSFEGSLTMVLMVDNCISSNGLHALIAGKEDPLHMQLCYISLSTIVGRDHK
ncbi:hypothetical protein VNO80_26933 [Phaseolus coccineus]|uniref:Uncharacterized protein n=1 Tax=Phaseolus coccineus TaxID=3886 RepID=A0AAN9LFP3_PHACN